MESIQAILINFFLHRQPYGWAKGTIVEQRNRQEKSVKWLRIPEEVKCDRFQLLDISAEWITPIIASKGAILYLHGGAFALGSIHIHREYLSRLAIATQRKILAIDYHLAPEHPFPRALEDAVKSYRWLLTQGYNPSEITVAGDSAGGGLALSTLISLKNEGSSLPGCAVLISPWVDLTLSGKSINQAARIDPILNSNILEMYARHYAAGNEKENPLVSPLFADLKGLPPLFIQVGTNEILLDDASRLSEKAIKAGIEVKFETWQGLFHVFQIIPFLPESKTSLAQISRFISDHTP